MKSTVKRTNKIIDFLDTSDIEDVCHKVNKIERIKKQKFLRFLALLIISSYLFSVYLGLGFLNDIVVSLSIIMIGYIVNAYVDRKLLIFY